MDPTPIRSRCESASPRRGLQQPGNRMSLDEQIATIHDADLIAEIEQARGHFMYKTIIEHIAHKQLLRDKERTEQSDLDARRLAMSRDQRRRDAVREVIENEPSTPENVQHIHSVLALCGLPYREPKGE